MKRQKIIVVTSRNEEPEVFGNFKKMCESKELPYHSLKILKFPITHKDLIIYKKDFQ